SHKNHQDSPLPRYQLATGEPPHPLLRSFGCRWDHQDPTTAGPLDLATQIIIPAREKTAAENPLAITPTIGQFRNGRGGIASPDPGWGHHKADAGDSGVK